MNVPVKGFLRDQSLPRIFIEINRAGKSGTLTVTSSGFTKNVYIRNGNVIFASSTLADDRLGEQLMKAGKITLDQYARSVELLKSTGKRQGTILVELGFITPQDLSWGVRHQVKEIICSLFTLEDGTYEFLEDRLPPEEVIILRVSMENLIYEGVDRIENLDHIRRGLPSDNSVLIKNTGPSGVSAVISPRSQDQSILSLFDGKRTFREAISDAQSNSLEVMKTLYVLWSAGFIIEKDHSEKTVVEEIKTKKVQEKAVSEEDLQYRAKFEDFFSNLPKMGPFEILGLNERSTVDEVKKSYYRLAKEFHPDRIHGTKDPELKKKAATVFDTITKAYETLKDESKKKAYLDSLTRKPQKEEDTEMTVIDEQFDRAIEEFKKGNFWGAAEFFRFVTRRSPKNPKAWSYLSLSLSKIPNKHKEAEEAMLEALKLEPFNSDHYANLGLLYLRTGLKLRAKAQFEKALKMNPGNEKAKKGLEHIS